MPGSFDMTTLSPSRTALRSRNQSFGEFTNSEEARKKEREKKSDALCEGEGMRDRERKQQM